MAKKIHYKTGKLAVYDDDTPAAFTNPEANLSAIYFHSDLDYFFIAYDQTRTLTLSATGVTEGTTDESRIFPAHNLGYIPYGFLIINGTQYPTGFPLQVTGNEGTARYIMLSMDSSDVWITTRHHATTGHGNSGISRSCRVILLGQATKTDVGYAARFRPSSGRLTLGEGKFDTNRDYLRRDDTNPDFYVSSGRTIDGQSGGGIRFVLPDGTVTSQQGYSGSFTGTQFFGLKD